MAFNAITDYADSSITLPVPNKDGEIHQYRIEGVDALTGIWVQDIIRVATKALGSEADVTEEDVAQIKLDDEEEQDLMRRLLGASYDKLIDDGVTWPWIQLVNQTALIWVASGRDQAETFWNSAGGDRPKAVKAPTDRRRPARSARPASPGGTNQPKQTAATTSAG